MFQRKSAQKQNNDYFCVAHLCFVGYFLLYEWYLLIIEHYTTKNIQKSVNKEQSRNNKEVKRASIVRYNDVSDESSLIRVYELITINV